MANSVIVEYAENLVLVETFDVYTDYYFINIAQVLAKNKEVTNA